MELFEIQSANDLSAHLPKTRSPVAHSYLVNRRQFMFVLGNWRKPNTARGPAASRDATFSLMTLAEEQIWMTESEITQIAGAIRSFHSGVSLARTAGTRDSAIVREDRVRPAVNDAYGRGFRRARGDNSMQSKLYVGNLSNSVSEKELKELFGQAGEVKEIVLITDRETQMRKGFGFVEMLTQTDAEKAIRMFNGQDLGGQSLTVDLAKTRENGGGNNRSHSRY